MTRTGLQAGSYDVTVTDVYGCELAEIIVIEEIKTLDLTVRKTDIDCDEPTGSLIIEGDNTPQYPILINGEDLGVTTGMEVTGLEYGTYIIEYEATPGCTIFVDEVRIRILSSFNVDITPAESDLMIGEELELQAVINGTLQEYEVVWTTEDPFVCVAEDQYGNCLSISVTPSTTQSIGLYVSDTTGCEDQAEAVIRVEDNRVVYVPNVFSPNGDGVNDVFIPVVGDPRAEVKAFRIFDRWGGLVYEEINANAVQLSGWDGSVDRREAQPGVFVYSLHIGYGDGTPEVIKGDLTLLK